MSANGPAKVVISKEELEQFKQLYEQVRTKKTTAAEVKAKMKPEQFQKFQLYIAKIQSLENQKKNFENEKKILENEKNSLITDLYKLEKEKAVQEKKIKEAEEAIKQSREETAKKMTQNANNVVVKGKKF